MVDEDKERVLFFYSYLTSVETYKNISLTAWIYLALCLVTLLDTLFPISFLLEISTALIFIFVAFEFRSVPRPQQIAGSILISLSLIAAAVSQDADGYRGRSWPVENFFTSIFRDFVVASSSRRKPLLGSGKGQYCLPASR